MSYPFIDPVAEQRIKDASQPVAPLRRLLYQSLMATPLVTEGIDLNKYQTGELSDPNALVASGRRFAIVEACWGLDARPTFAEFWQPLVAAEIFVFPYQFFRGDQDGTDQAEFLLETAMPMWEAQGCITPAFADVERFIGDTSTPAVRVPRFIDWTEAIRRVARPGAYSNIPSWRDLMNNLVLADDIIGWAAHYTPYWEAFLVPVGWRRENVKFLQYGIARVHSWCPAVPGLDGDVSCDKFFGTEQQLYALGEEIVAPPGGNMELLEAISVAIDLDNQLAAQLQEVKRLAELQPDPDPIPDPEPPPPPPDPDPIPEPPPVSTDITIKITKSPRANARFSKKPNAAGKPIMQIYPSDSAPVSERIQFAVNTLLKAKQDKVIADGGGKYFQLTHHAGRAGEALFIYDQEAAKI